MGYLWYLPRLKKPSLILTYQKSVETLIKVALVDIITWNIRQLVDDSFVLSAKRTSILYYRLTNLYLPRLNKPSLIRTYHKTVETLIKVALVDIITEWEWKQSRDKVFFTNHIQKPS